MPSQPSRDICFRLPRLVLTREQQAMVDRILKAVNPNIRSVLVTFSHKKDERTFKYVPTVDQTAVHFADDGHSIRRDSDEAKRQVCSPCTLKFAVFILLVALNDVKWLVDVQSVTMNAIDLMPLFCPTPFYFLVG